MTNEAKARRQLFILAGLASIGLFGFAVSLAAHLWGEALFLGIMLFVLTLMIAETYTLAWPNPRLHFHYSPPGSKAQMWFLGFIFLAATSVLMPLGLVRPSVLVAAGSAILLAGSLIRLVMTVKTEGWSGNKKEKR